MARYSKLPTDRWGRSDVAITLTGEEWFTLIAIIGKHHLSDEGYLVGKRATVKLLDQITASSKEARQQ